MFLAAAWWLLAMQWKKWLETVKPRNKQKIINWMVQQLPEQRAWATILDDVLNVSNAARVDRDAIIKEFAQEYDPVKTLMIY